MSRLLSFSRPSADNSLRSALNAQFQSSFMKTKRPGEDNFDYSFLMLQATLSQPKQVPITKVSYHSSLAHAKTLRPILSNHAKLIKDYLKYCSKTEIRSFDLTQKLYTAAINNLADENDYDGVCSMLYNMLDPDPQPFTTVFGEIQFSSGTSLPHLSIEIVEKSMNAMHISGKYFLLDRLWSALNKSKFPTSIKIKRIMVNSYQMRGKTVVYLYNNN
jgi:hypothetical protein